MDAGFRADFLIDTKAIIELKSMKVLASVYFKQVQTYFKVTGFKLRLLINFNVSLIKDSIHRNVNKL